ncbi:MAG TPA: AAA family ATPase [Thermoanaerobaculia bacterium]|nr:AAA family ATPase [Thermoanaerobaculia bacterium]
MKKLVTDPAVRLAWRIAGHLAANAGNSEIEPLHLFAGVLKILDDAFQYDAVHAGASPEEIAEIAQAARVARAGTGIDEDAITRMRRAATHSIPERECHVTKSMHRSAECLAVFDQATSLALEERSPSMTLLHLWRSFASDPPVDVAAFIARKPAVQWETRVDDFVSQFQLNRITFVLTDVEGSTSIKRTYGDVESAKIFRAHDNLFREELKETRDGREIKTIGDAFLLAFGSEAEAVRFCVRVQSRLRADPVLAAIPVRVRMGIFSGPVLTKGTAGSGLSDPVFGITIDTTSRISSLAVGGQILTTSSVFEAAHEEIGQWNGLVEWRSHGEFHLKGLDEPVEIYEAGERGVSSFVRPSGSEKAVAAVPPPASKRGLLATVGRDLTALARQGRHPPVVARRQEMKTIARHLTRTSKRNVLLVGEPGVGKTVLVQGLAALAAAPEAPEWMRRLRFVEIDLGELVAGTKHRGDLEARVAELVAEAESDPDLVLFFDEVHRALSGEASDAASLLKPSLSAGTLRCIAATTNEELERHVQRDPAFIRRFHLLRLAEPGREEAIGMCRAWAEWIERRQEVRFAPEAVETAVDLARRSIPSRRLPDAAIDLLEGAAAAVKTPSLTVQARPPSKELPLVDGAAIATTLREQYGAFVVSAEVLDLGKLEIALPSRLGPEVAATLLSILRRNGDNPRRRPLAVLLVRGNAAPMIDALVSGFDAGGGTTVFHMNQFSDRHELSRLTGAPPGFVGHEEGGALFRFTQAHPRGVIVLDGIESAHPAVRDFFQQIFVSGEALDARGRSVDFRPYVFALTGGASAGHVPAVIGFNAPGETSYRTETLPPYIDGIIEMDA